MLSSVSATALLLGFCDRSTQDDIRFGKVEMPLAMPNAARAARRQDDVFLPTAVAECPSTCKAALSRSSA